MGYVIRYNAGGDVSIVRDGEPLDQLSLEWKKNVIDQKRLERTSTQPKVLVGERVGLTQESGSGETQRQLSVSINNNGASFLNRESQNLLLSLVVTDSEGNEIPADDFGIMWMINGVEAIGDDLLEVRNDLLRDQATNIISVEVTSGGHVYRDSIQVLKYLGFDVDQSSVNGNVIGGDHGRILRATDQIQVLTDEKAFKVGNNITFRAPRGEEDDFRGHVFWGFGDGLGAKGVTVSHMYFKPGIFTVEIQLVSITSSQRETYTMQLEIK